MSYEFARPRAARPIPGIATRTARRQQQPATYRQLGDVGGFFDDLFSTPDKIISTWAAQVTARGNRVTRMPSGAQVGKLAERRDTSTGNYTIQLAPANVLQADAAVIAAGRQAIATDSFFTSVQPGALLKDTGKLVGAGVSAITGIPSWAIPVLIVGGGAFFLMSATKSLFPKGR